jgi:hypothetical protein
MIPVFSAHLEACDPAQNRWRSYRVEAGRDLFGTWVVAITFGRIGATRGRTVTYIAGDELGAQRLARACLCGFRRKPATHSDAKPASVPI